MLNFTITSQWFLWCLAALLIPVLFFRIRRTFRDKTLSLQAARLSALLRAVSGILLIALCVDLSWERTVQRQVKPSVAVIWDNSASMLSSDSSAAWRDEFISSHFYRSLKEKAHITHFPGTVAPRADNDRAVRRLKFDENTTDLGRQLENTAAAGTWDAMVLVSDGLSYTGADLETLVLEDDPGLIVLMAGEIAENDHPHVSEIVVQTPKKKGDSLSVLIRFRNRSRRSAASSYVLMLGDSLTERFSVTLDAGLLEEKYLKMEAPAEGLHSIKLGIEDKGSVQTVAEQAFLIGGKKTRIAVSADPPDADAAAMARVLREAGYEIVASHDPSVWKTCDCLIKTSKSDEFTAYDVPVLELLRPHGDWRQVRTAAPAGYHEALNFFMDPVENAAVWKQLPPVYIPQDVRAEGETMLSARDGTAFCERINSGHIRIRAKGLWVWRTAAYRRDFYGLYEHFVTGLVADCSGENTKALHFKRRILQSYEGQDVSVDLSLAAARKSRQAVLGVSAYDEQGREIWREEKAAHELPVFQAGAAAAGNYLLKADLSLAGQEIMSDTAFLQVKAEDPEKLYKGADSLALAVLAGNNGGIMLPVARADEALKNISLNKIWRQVHRQVSLRSVWFVYVLMLVSAAAEWILRKRAGSI